MIELLNTTNMTDNYKLFEHLLETHGLCLMESELDEIRAIANALSWESIEQFQQQANEGWCWIVHKGRVTEAYYDYNQQFRFNRISTDVFMSECITAVMPWTKPRAPGRPHTCNKQDEFPRPVYNKRDGTPCGECHMKIGERCDICGIRYVA